MPPPLQRKLLAGHAARSPKTAPSGCVALLGLPFVCVGSVVVAIGAGWLPGHGADDPRQRQVMMTFGAVFAAIGALLIWSTITGKVRAARRRGALRVDPRQPWLADYPWEATGDTLKVGTKTAQALLGLLLFSGFLAPFNLLFFPFPPIVIFDLLAAGGWVWFLYYLTQSGKYGDSRLRYATFPFYLGGQAVLYLEAIDRLKGLRQLKVTLRCIEEAIETRSTNSGSSSRTVCYALYEDERIFQPAEIPFGEGSPARFFSFARQVDASAALRLEMALPSDERLETCLGRAPARYWELEVKAETPGVDFSATFLVPVYRDPGSEIPATLPE